MDITPLVTALQAMHGNDAFRARLTQEQWQRLVDAMERRELSPGELLLRRGEIESRAYLVESGQLQVFVVGGPPRSHRIATLHAGSLVGEPGLFAATPRMAHVEAMTHCVVWSLSASRLRELAAEDPALVLEVLRAAGAVMAVRMRDNLERGIPLS
jgi:CRP/FNR family cyclic AMP-dependent transcriptional regulator